MKGGEITRFYRSLNKHKDVVKKIESEYNAPYIIRKPIKTIKKIAEWELYKLSELTIQYPEASQKTLDELKNRLWLIMGIK